MPRGRHDLPRVLAFLGAHAVPGVEHWDGRTWTAALGLPRAPGVAHVVTADGVAAVTLHLGDDRDEPDALRRLGHALDLDTDVGAGERVLAADPLIGPAVARRPGLRVPGVLDAWEILVRTVVGQQVSVSGARSVTARLVRAVGEPLPPWLVELAPALSHTFPAPDAVAALAPDTDVLAMPRARARTVLGAAALVDAGRRAGLPADDLPPRDALLDLPGIGPWTADYLDLRVRRDPDVLLVTDLAVRRSVERLGHDSSPRAVGRLAERWRPHRSLALAHLWAEYLDL